MLIRQQQCLATLLLLLTFLVSCNSAKPTPTASTAIRSLLVQPADIGWPDDSYFEGDGIILGEDSVEEMLLTGIGPDPLPRRSSNVSLFRSTQYAWIYTDKDAATRSFQMIKERYQLSHLSEGLQLELLPTLTDSWWFCSEGLNDMVYGNYVRCFVLVQNEHILMLGIMPVNGTAITMEDWQNFMAQLHRRLIDYSLDSEAEN